MRISLEKAQLLLASNQVVAVPTETVYGLAASLSSETAVKQIFTLKKRPSKNPLIIHTDTIEDIEPFVTSFPRNFYHLAEQFWPGPLTIILPIKVEMISTIVRADLQTAAFRIPALDITRSLLKQTGPLVMPSANKSGSPSSTCPKHVENDFGQDFPVLDGGICHHGLESTILYFNEEQWEMGRLGSIPAEAFLPILGYIPRMAQKSQDPICPGQLFRHYAPKAKLHLGITESSKVILGFSDRKYNCNAKIYFLGNSRNALEVGENLYRMLRQLDVDHQEEVWVDIDFPQDGLWKTILERLTKASCRKVTS